MPHLRRLLWTLCAASLASCSLNGESPGIDGGTSVDGGRAVDGGGEDSGTLDAGHGLLTRQGTRLYLDGQPYVALGVNAYGMAGCQTGRPFSPADLDAFFASLRPLALTRTWAFEPQGLAALDTIIHSAQMHGQMLILSLGDSLNDCGDQDGVPDGGHGKAAGWYVSGYQGRYLGWVQQVVARYKDSPAIGMWEILNEPGAAAQGTLTDSQVRAFFDDVAATIKTIDPLHLVESGSQAEYVSGTTNYAYVHGGPNVDVGSLHEYDYDYQNSHTIVSPHFQPCLAGMSSIQKPLLVGESGIMANDGTGCTNRPTRADAFRQKLDAYLDGGAVGMMVWDWAPTKSNACAYETLYPADPTMALLFAY